MLGSLYHSVPELCLFQNVFLNVCNVVCNNLNLHLNLLSYNLVNKTKFLPVLNLLSDSVLSVYSNNKSFNWPKLLLVIEMGSPVGHTALWDTVSYAVCSTIAYFCKCSHLGVFASIKCTYCEYAVCSME